MNLANRITVFRVLLIPLFIALFPIYPETLISQSAVLQHLDAHGIFYAALIFITASATDKLDGYIARKYNQITNLGKLLDPLADKLLISTALILMVNLHLIPAWIACVIIGREFIITAIRIVASAQKIALSADKYGKWKMVLQVTAISAVLLNDVLFSRITVFPIPQALMYLALLMTVFSGYNYIKSNDQILKLHH